MWLSNRGRRSPGGWTEIKNRYGDPIIQDGKRIGAFSTYEMDSFTCVHCNKVTFVPARCDPVELGGRCTCCDDLICKDCVGKPCLPLEKKLDLYERGVLKVLR